MFLSFSIRNKELDKPISGNKGRLLGQGHSLASSSLTSLRSGPHLRINLEAQSFASCGTHSNGQVIAVVGIPNLLQAAYAEVWKKSLVCLVCYQSPLFLESEARACNPFETLLSCWRQIARSATESVTTTASDAGFRFERFSGRHGHHRQVSSQASNPALLNPQCCTLVMMAKLMPQVSACTKDRDEDLVSQWSSHIFWGWKLEVRNRVILRIFMVFDRKRKSCIITKKTCQVKPNHWVKSSSPQPLSSPTCWWTPSRWKVPRAARANISCLKMGRFTAPTTWKWWYDFCKLIILIHGAWICKRIDIFIFMYYKRIWICDCDSKSFTFGYGQFWPIRQWISLVGKIYRKPWFLECQHLDPRFKNHGYLDPKSDFF